MNKNIRISLAIFIIALLTLLSGQFEDEVEKKVVKKELFTVETIETSASPYQPLIKLKSTTVAETRVEVKAKTSGEVVKIGSRQGDYVNKDSILCSLGIVELNRTEVKAPFSGYLEMIVKPGNFLERGQVCATIIQLNPITFVAEVPESDINKFGEAVALGTPFRKFAKTLEREREPGTYNHYVSIDSQMLGMLIMEVTGKPLEDYLHEKIWNKIGMESDAYYLTDSVGDAMALGGLNATLRDYAKFGQLYLNKGSWEGRQIVPSEWVEASYFLDAPHVQPMAGELSANTWGYGFQWWVPGFPDTDYTAAGVYNQYIYIDPITNVVIAKTSSNYRFTSERQESKDAHISMFREIAKAANGGRG